MVHCVYTVNHGSLCIYVVNLLLKKKTQEEKEVYIRRTLFTVTESDFLYYYEPKFG